MTHNDTIGTRFGLGLAIAVPMITGIVAPRIADFSAPWWAFPAGWVIAVLTLAFPGALYRISVPSARLGSFIGICASSAVLSFLYLILVIPMGFLARFLGKDFLACRRDEAVSSYRVPSEQRPKETFRDPF